MRLQCLQLGPEVCRKETSLVDSTHSEDNTFQHQAAMAYFGSRGEKYRLSTRHGNPEALRKVVETVAPEGGELLLDIGTGPGHTAVAFGPYIRQAIATDLTLGMLRQVPILSGEKGVDNVVTTVVDVHAIPFKDATFDIVTCRQAAHHFADLAVAVQEMARVCKPEGKVFMVDMCGNDGAEAHQYQDAIERLRDSSHVTCHPREEWVHLFKTSGLRVDYLLISSGRRGDLETWMDRSDTPPEARRKIYEMLQSPPESVLDEVEVGEHDGQWYFSTRQIHILGRKYRP
jgi:ubiquinone/menaquinone biosynthesis C-methylase UbiE